jgi:iron complex outermembrane recepter protein
MARRYFASMRRLLASVALVVGASTATAQESARRDSVAPLPAVTVTATRAAAAVLTTPLAVTKIEAAELRSRSGFGLDEALRLVPGVLAQSRYGTSDVRIVIRGYGARGAGDRSNAGTSRGIRVLIDGIPETEPDGRTSFDQIDLAASEAVEVVRSNASAVWGNASGGVINLLTVPLAGDPRIEAQPVFGNFGLQRYAARGSTPLGASGTGYVNFTHTDWDGWREHSSARRALVNIGAVGSVGGRTRVGVYASGANNLFHIPGPLTQAQVDQDPRQANATYAARDERRHNRVMRLGTTVEHAVDSATSLSAMLFVSPKYLQRSERNTFRDFTRYHVGGNVTGRRQIALSTASRMTLSVGADEAYQDGAILFYSLTPQGTRGPTLRDNKAEGANNLGVFIQDEIWVRERLAVTLGARYDDVTYNYRSYITPELSDRKSFARVTPKIGLMWLFDGTRSIYANVGGGIEVPAGNETDPAGTFGQDTVYAINPLLEPIRSTTYEIGFKSIPASSTAAVRWSYDLALYTTDVRNELVPYQGGRFYFTAGQARRSGAELGLDVNTRAGLFAQTALTFSRNRYVRYAVDSVHYGRPGAFADYSGNEVVGVPDVIANAEAGLEVPGFRALRLKGGVEHTGRYFVDDANTVRVPAYTTLSATLELRDPVLTAGGWGVRGFVSVYNLADRRYIGSAFLNPDRVNGEPVAFEPGMPRSVVVSISARRVR